MRAAIFIGWLCVITSPTTLRVIAKSAATAGGDVSTGAVTPVGHAEAAKEQA